MTENEPSNVRVIPVSDGTIEEVVTPEQHFKTPNALIGLSACITVAFDTGHIIEELRDELLGHVANVAAAAFEDCRTAIEMVGTQVEESLRARRIVAENMPDLATVVAERDPITTSEY